MGECLPFSQRGTLEFFQVLRWLREQYWLRKQTPASDHEIEMSESGVDIL